MKYILYIVAILGILSLAGCFSVDQKEGDNSVPKDEGSYKNGKMHGVWKTYHANGKIATLSLYMDGKKNGPYTSFDTSGQIIQEGIYRMDSLVNNSTAFIKEVDIEELNLDKYTGEVKFRDENGVLRTGNKLNGVDTGRWTISDSTDKLMEEIIYDSKGKLIKKNKY